MSNIITGFIGSGSDPFDTSRSSINTLIGVLYFCYFWSAQRGGQTLGMRVLNLNCLFVGVIWAVFDAQKQGWHDEIARTYAASALSSVTAPSATSAGRHP